MHKNEKHPDHSLTGPFSEGLRDGIPIALGYLSVSFAIGMAAVAKGLPVWSAILISMTNLTSAGQVAGINLIIAQGSLFEMALTELIINLRYALMSLSWSQKMDKSVTLPERCLVAFGNTDEIFAVSSTKEETLTTKYLLGLILLPYIGWSAGTAFGALLSSALPEIISSALGIAVYGMFLAIIVPAAGKSRSILIVVLIATVMSCCFYYIPLLNTIGNGFVIIICAISAAAFGAWRFPINETGLSDKTDEV